ncbi:MAG: hypothetical protein A2342_08100 [Gallionellales bacterium RIFOXYB12_FULL_54_9]|nr:MAG: hypothetical protein A2342_08100 [Gallionellales bacterium RIFOXYB12_FULL_54_9]
MSSISGLMRYVRYVKSQEVQGTVESRQTNLKSRNHFVAESDRLHESRPRPPGDQDKPGRRSTDQGDRRKVSRRITRQSVMVEFRSAIGRRRRHLREGDVVVHVNIKV